MPSETDNSTFSKLNRLTTSDNSILKPLNYNCEACDREMKIKKKKFPSQHNHFPIINFYSPLYWFFSPHPDRIKNQNRATGDSLNGQSLIFEPSIMVCVTFVCVCVCVLTIWFMWWWFREINWFHLRLLARNIHSFIHSFHRSFTQFFLPRKPIQFPQKYNDCKFIPHLIPPNPAIRALLVFHKDDPISDAMARSCERLNIEASRAKTTEVALETFQSPVSGGHHLVIVDGRCKNIDFESFGRWVGLGVRVKVISMCFLPHEQIIAKLQRQSVHDHGGSG